MPDYPDSDIRIKGLAVLGCGEVYCEHKGDRVDIGGEAAIYMPVPGMIVP